MEQQKIYFGTIKIENAVNADDMLRLEGFCCHFNTRNLNDEIVTPSSFDKFFTLYNEKKLKPNLNYNHTDTIVGGIDTIESRDKGLWMTAHLNNNVAIVRDMLTPNILSGDINGFSTEGFVAGGYDGIISHDDGSYTVKDFLLTGVAVVSNPADWDATFSVKNFIENFAKAREEEAAKALESKRLLYFI